MPLFECAVIYLAKPQIMGIYNILPVIIVNCFMSKTGT